MECLILLRKEAPNLRLNLISIPVSIANTSTVGIAIDIATTASFVVWVSVEF